MAFGASDALVLDDLQIHAAAAVHDRAPDGRVFANAAPENRFRYHDVGHIMRLVSWALIAFLPVTLLARAPIRAAARLTPAVSVVQVPNGGIQPQAVADAEGIIHLVYFRGAPAGGDLFYVTLASDGRASSPIRVNSIAGSAIATGSVRGAQIAVGPNGRVHVAWNGSKPAEAPGGPRIPMWYARSKPGALAFEAQRALTTWTEGLDGGGAIAADRSGRVTVAWHAMGATPAEAQRTVYLAKSSNDGMTFSKEARATAAAIGSCGCCGMRALFDRAGRLQLLFRAATDAIDRDATWLTVGGGPARHPVRLHAWRLEACPMTTFGMAEGPGGLFAAWETQQQIYSAMLDPATGRVSGLASGLASVPGAATRKHPSVAVNEAGDRLLAWTEGTAWNRGGTVAWRLVDSAGQQLAAAAGAGPVPVWGLVAAVAARDGSFVILR